MILTFFILFLSQLFVLYWYAQSIASVSFSFIGDEYATYDFARYIAGNIRAINPFSLQGVYGENPVLGSYIQGFLMKILGINIYAWKMTSLIAIVPIGILTYYICKALFKKQGIAILGVVLTDVSFYYHHFFQIGYINVYSLIMLYVLLFLLIKLKFTNNDNPLLYYAIGITIGLSWYLYIGKLFVVIVLSFIAIKRCNIKQICLYVSIPALVIITYGFIITPQFFQYLGITKTIFKREFYDNSQIIYNIIHGFTLQIYTSSPSHYLPVNAYVDPFTGIVSSVGIISVALTFLYRLVKKQSLDHMHNLFVFFLIFCIVLGIASPYPYPPTTRGIHYMPFYILFACYTFVMLLRFIKNRSIQLLYIVSIIIIEICINFYFIYKPQPLNITQHILKKIWNSNNKRIIGIRNCSLNIDNLKTLNDGYLLSNTVEIQDIFTSEECNRYDIVVNCKPIPCKIKSQVFFDNSVTWTEIAR